MDCFSIRTLVRAWLEQLCPANLPDQCPTTILPQQYPRRTVYPFAQYRHAVIVRNGHYRHLARNLNPTCSRMATIGPQPNAVFPVFADCRRRQPLPQHARISALVYLLPHRIQPDSVADTFLSERCFRRPFIYPNQTVGRRYSRFIDFNRHGKPQLGISKSDPI